MSRRALLVSAGGVLLAICVGLFAIFGSEGQNLDYQPQNEFKLDPWVSIHIGSLDLSINKAVLYLFLATALTVWAIVYVAKRMEDKPNRVQTAVEAIYDLAYSNITRGNMGEEMARKWFPFVAALFVWILFSNLLGYIPLPTNTLEKFNVFGAHIPSFAIYAATANISIPLVLTLIVCSATTSRESGPRAPASTFRAGSRPVSRARRASRSSGSSSSRTSCGSSPSPSDCSRTSSPATC